MFCMKCGKEIKEEWTRCPFCGTEISQNTVVNQETEISEENFKREFNTEKKPKKKKGIVKKILLGLGIVFILLIILAVIGGNSDNEDSQIKETVDEDVIKTLEEVGGFGQWQKDGFPGKVRTDIIIDLPVKVKDVNNYAVRVGALGNDIIIIMNKDETATNEWEWLVNAVPYLEGENIAYFKATLKFLGKKDSDKYPVFLYEDIEPYVETTIDEDQQDTEIEYIFPDSDKKYLSEDEVRSVEVDKLRIGRNEIFARHGVIFKSEDLQKYFSGCSWYEGTVSVDSFSAEATFNDFEKKNVELIKRVEDEVNGANPSGGIDTSLIQEYCNEVGYYGGNSNAYLYFGSINGNKIEITLADELGILNWYTGTIIDKNTVEFTSGDCLQTIHFNGNYSFTITGNPGFIDLSGDYFINAG